MTQKKKPTKNRRIWPWITLAVIVILVGGLRLAMRADFVMDRIRSEVENRASEMLNANLHIGRMHGDLWSHLRLEDIQIVEEPGNTVVSVETLAVSYNIMDLIFRRPLEIQSVLITGLHADISQNDEGLWNILALLPETEEGDPATDDTDAGVPSADPLEIKEPFPFIIHEIRITAPMISVNAEVLFPEEPFFIRDVDIFARLGQNETGLFMDLHHFELFVHESRLDAPVQLESGASWDGRRITLDKLVIAGAHTLFEAAGNYDNVTKGGELQASFDPLAWKEVAAYLDAYPVRQDLEISLFAGGSRQDFRAGVTLDGPGIENLHVSSGWTFMQEPVLNRLEVSSGYLDIGKLTGSDTLRAQTRELVFLLEGVVPLNEWDRVAADGKLTVRDLQFNDYHLDELAMDLKAQNGTAAVKTELQKGEESILLNLQAEQWWEAGLNWSLNFELSDVNPAYWSGQEALEGTVTAFGSLKGNGYSPGSEPWISDLEIIRLHLSGYPEASLTMQGEITGDSLVTVATLMILDGEIDLESEVFWRSERPEYKLALQLHHLNMARYPGLQDLETQLNGSVNLSGEGIHPESMSWMASVHLIDSEINRQDFDQVELDFTLKDGIVEVVNGFLSSIPARGHLSMTQNIFDLRDPENRLDFNLELLNLQGFANLAGTDSLQAKGTLAGSIHPNDAGHLVFQSDLQLEEVQYDTIRVRSIAGSASVLLEEVMSYQADLVLTNPRLGSHALQDITIITNGRYSENRVAGDYEVTVNIENTTGLRTKAEYEFGDTTRIHTYALELADPAGRYQLRNPFDVILSDDYEYVLVESLVLESDLESVIAISLMKTPDTPWTGFVDIRDTDLGQIQYVFLEEPFFDAMFTGRIEFIIDDEELNLNGQVNVTKFRNNDLELDSLYLDFVLADRRLDLDAGAWHFDKELLRAEFNIPFEPRNPETLEAEFFEESVSGYLRIHPVDISLFEVPLTGLGLENMRGEFSLESTLQGTAGSPEMTGELRLQDGVLSGVSVDTLLLSWDYDHSRSDIYLTSRIHSLGQKAADISGRLPLYVDFQHFQVSGPESDDQLELSIYTSDFDMAAFGDFLNPLQMHDLRGLLNAEIVISGTFADPVMEGDVILSGGQLGLRQTNTTLRNIRMDVGFEPGRIQLNRLSVQSVGTINGRGSITLDGFTPDELDIRLNATNFRVFNTRDIEIYSGLDLRLEGSLEHPVVRGDVRWERGTLFVDDFGERDVEEVVLEEEEERVPGGPDIYERMEMEVKFTVDRNAFVRNRRDPEINLALRGELDLLKQPFGELQLFGDMNIDSGHVTTFNRRFQLEHGSILFSGDPSDPQLNIRTLYKPRQQYDDVSIYYVITGTVSDPQFDYESEPEMELQDIISYTIFGRPFLALAGWEQTMSGRSDGSMATNIAVDLILDRIETLASDRLGIDVIEIENTRKGGGSGTSIKAGKYVTDRLFIAFLQELGGTEAGRQVVIEYLVLRNLELILTASDDYRSGVDMLWRYDY